jgi:hypothetical protein
MPSVEVPAQRKGIIVCAAVVHDADNLDRQRHGKGLPRLVIEAVFVDSVDIGRVDPLWASIASFSKSSSNGHRMVNRSGTMMMVVVYPSGLTLAAMSIALHA